MQADMKIVDDCVKRLHDDVNYIDGSDSQLKKLEQCNLDSNIAFSGKLRWNFSSRWNSTYFIIMSALQERVAIDLLPSRDSSFEYRLTLYQWEIVKYFLDFLEPFYHIILLFSASEYATANLYFKNIIAIERLFTCASIAILLDPCYKMRFVQSMFGCGCGRINEAKGYSSL